MPAELRKEGQPAESAAKPTATGLGVAHQDTMKGIPQENTANKGQFPGAHGEMPGGVKSEGYSSGSDAGLKRLPRQVPTTKAQRLSEAVKALSTTERATLVKMLLKDGDGDDDSDEKKAYDEDDKKKSAMRKDDDDKKKSAMRKDDDDDDDDLKKALRALVKAADDDDDDDDDDMKKMQKGLVTLTEQVATLTKALSGRASEGNLIASPTQAPRPGLTKMETEVPLTRGGEGAPGSSLQKSGIAFTISENGDSILAEKPATFAELAKMPLSEVF